MEWLILLYLLSRAREAARPGEETTVKARDGSSHRVRFVSATNRATGKTTTGWVALSTDTGLHFKEGERVTVKGESRAWHAAPGPLEPGGPSAFTGGAFL